MKVAGTPFVKIEYEVIRGILPITRTPIA